MAETNSPASLAQLKAENAQAASQAEAEKACTPEGTFGSTVQHYEEKFAEVNAFGRSSRAIGGFVGVVAAVSGARENYKGADADCVTGYMADKAAGRKPNLGPGKM